MTNILGSNSENLLVNFSSYLFYPAIIGLAPCYYLYILNFDPNEENAEVPITRHFIPALILLLVNVFSFVAIPQMQEKNSELLYDLLKYINFFIYVIFFLIQNTYYIVKSVSWYKDHGVQYQQGDKENVKTLLWLKYYISSYIFIFTCLYLFQFSFMQDFKDLFRAILLLYICSLIYFGYRKYPILLSSPIQKYLDSDQKMELSQSINKAIHQDKLFLDKNLSLHSFAKEVNSNSKYLSKYINNEYGKNFSSFITEFRILEAKSLLKDPAYNVYTIESIADMVGYNSKSSFNNAFKKIVGMTPSEFKSN